MRDVRFKNHSATGARDAPWEYAPLDQFLLATPMFYYQLTQGGVIPPLHVLNECLRAGTHHAGMSGASDWKPFELTQDEYEELVENLVTHPDYQIEECRELWDRPNYKKWSGAALSRHSRRARNES